MRDRHAERDHAGSLPITLRVPSASGDKLARVSNSTLVVFILVLGAAAGGLVTLVLALILQLPDCPECGQKPSRFRWPSNGRQAVRGGWTCRNCGTEMDRKGRRVVDA